jgi:hypothetical protein
MLKQAVLSSILVATAIVGAPSLLRLPTTETFAQTQKFFCDKSGSIPATVAQTRRGNVRLITWERTIAGQYTPLQRCQEVSSRFQEFHSKGWLRFITSGRQGGSNVICVAEAKNQACRPNGMLFTLSPENKPIQVLSKMFSLGARADTGQEIRETTSRVYVDFEACMDKRSNNQSCEPVQ